MFGMPIDKIEFIDVENFCKSGIRESIILDFKKDFPARLEKTMAAFANTHGGVALLGVDETSTGAAVLPISGLSLTPGLRERVIQIGLDAVYPPVIPEVKVVEFKSGPSAKSDDRAVVVIRVNESDVGSHAVDKRTTVYLRVENLSDPYRKATVDELEWFMNKRQKALEEKNRIVQLASSHAHDYLIRLRSRHSLPTTYPNGRFVVWTVPTYPRAPLASPQEIVRLFGRRPIPRPYLGLGFPSGWPHPVFEGVCFGELEAKQFDYTELHQQGLLYHESGFSWDVNGGKWLTYLSPLDVASTLDCLLKYSTEFYSEFGYWGLIDLEFRIEGARGRRLGSPSEIDALTGRTGAPDDSLAFRIRRSSSELQSSRARRDIAKQLLTDIHWSFGIEVDPETVVQQFKECSFLTV
jgi:hypothetical protein